jgi:hypothetical protein
MFACFTFVSSVKKNLIYSKQLVLLWGERKNLEKQGDPVKQLAKW